MAHGWWVLGEIHQLVHAVELSLMRKPVGKLWMGVVVRASTLGGLTCHALEVFDSGQRISRFKCVDFSRCPQSQNLQSLVLSHQDAITCVTKKPELFLANHCLYIFPFWDNAKSRSSHTTTLNNCFDHPISPPLWCPLVS